MPTKIRMSFFLLIILIMITNPISGQETGMVVIPGGIFTMGKNSISKANYKPAHQVTLDSFLIDRYEVTNSEYLRFCTATEHRLPEFWNVDIFRCGEKYADYPVVGVSWSDADKYAEWASKRLPTEAEWEYAARGGLVGKEYPNGNNWDKSSSANLPGNWTNRIEPVGQFEANGFGLHDMAGNVWEWTADHYVGDYYSISPEINPPGPDKGTGRVIRGGSWHSGPGCKKVYYRSSMSANWVDFAIGFRCVKDIEEE